MKTKPADVPYCGVDQDKIRNAKPVLNEEVIRHHNHFIFERHSIKKKKDAGLPRPWTDDPILNEYRFTNVRREDDRESQYLIKNISESEMTLENKIYNTLFMRMYNKWETIVRLGGVRDWSVPPDINYYSKLIDDEMKRDPSYVWFTNAYNMGGMKRAAGSNYIMTRLNEEELSEVDMSDLPSYDGAQMLTGEFPDVFYIPGYLTERVEKAHPEFRTIVVTDQNIPIRIIKRVAQMKKEKLFERIMSCSNQKEVFDLMQSIKGYGKFLGYQLFVDFTYIPEFPFSENEFVVAGPGAERGLQLLVDDFDGLSYAEMLFWLRDNLVDEWKARGLDWDLNELFSDKEEHDRCLNLMQLQNCKCELFKFVRTIRGDGRPKVKYKEFVEPSSIIQSSLEDFI